ncbi:MAG TPA: aldo/keto reductase [Gaiellaceae bacterium]|nr:aldo/keto reductase [Gaiellaceae bacterium]HYA07987.1 aldo/keto reductase [Gaiellaceae bacterium]
MRLQELGSSGIRVSRVGLGCNNFGGRLDLVQTRQVVEAALEAEINFLDTADIYGGGGSERFLGEILEGRRDEVVLATKFGMGPDEGMPRGSREYLRRALAASLERLRADYVDVYYYHQPDGITPIAETIAAMVELVEEERVRAIGVSNFSVAQLDEAVAAGPVAALQNHYSLLEREAEADVLPRCAELGVGFVPYFPLASGLLTGKYRRGEPPPPGTRLAGRPEALTDEAFDRIEALEAFAGERGHTLLELAIAGLASRAGVASVIAGATKPEQVRANVAAGDWELSADDLAALRDL